MNFKTIRAALLDLDGVMYRGTQLCHGAQPFIELLRGLDVAPFFLSNNSRSGPEAVADKLTSLGIPTERSEVITAAEVLVRHMAGRRQKGTAAVIGSDWLRTNLVEAGWRITEQQSDCLVVGLDHDLNYPKLRLGVDLLLKGAEFVAANLDRVNPIETTLEPGCGAIVAALAAASGRSPRCIGKPNLAMLRLALTRLDVGPEQAVMIGDSLDSDMRLARRGGVHSILVLSGQTSQGEIDRLPERLRPEMVLTDLAELAWRWEESVGSGASTRAHGSPWK